ncbi:hypothetical protein A2955_01760 [Candidatus Woesebacteria bacterium RIFCSPLOWO2_01_FULL_37_19]|uniref:Glycosyltransferase RgtA/B/C/D-like domain-containing protein n=2 Tax=Candidatus Woeseibacteriota TaxID=1752722 RepID=A0A1F8BA99_9BACT|nr:MAG: hypothetical protein A2771_02300 [Candidatus Woesebacteria bacterium RIFCSPHIGHO2_01_FULL_38_26b]OGM60974.1 MAG: hypothetical protein A2955_01760 [Candidatus Woesebacteria bacterium RIFCSPLOWO2_01_FULL_37_19]
MKISDYTGKWWVKWLLIGILIRLILMPITLHPDLWVFSSSGYLLAYEGKLNVYEHLVNLPSNHPLVSIVGNIYEYFIYPPLAHVTFGIFHLILRPFTDPSFIPNFWRNPDSIFGNQALPWHLFLYKLPYLFIDIVLAFLLTKLFDDAYQKKLAFVLWIANPLSFYTTFMMGQFDLLPVFFTVLALIFAKKKNFTASLLSLGIGGSFKMYPLFFVVPAAFLFGKTFWERSKYVIQGFFPYLLTIAPFITSAAFRQMVLFSPKNQKMLFMGFPVSGAEVLYPFIIILTLIYFHSLYSKIKYELDEYFLLILLLFFSVTHYHPQWFLWATPFLLIYLIRSKFKFNIVILTLFGAWLFLTLLFEASLSYGLFNPLIPSLKDAISPAQIINKYTDVFQLKSIARSFFAACSIFIFWTVSQRKNSTS